ncbi:MAG TPA: hypothetical protein VKR22_01510, partial [Acidimicrobiales bacterium]|nr:hypothetical protein [Acidimicrobiales bacterium]
MTTLVLDDGAGQARAEQRRAQVRAIAQRTLGRRRVTGRAALSLCALALGVALAPLVAMVTYTIGRGAKALSLSFLSHGPTPPGIPGGGISNAIVGSAVILGLASAMAVPVGITTAVFLL